MEDKINLKLVLFSNTNPIVKSKFSLKLRMLLESSRLISGIFFVVENTIHFFVFPNTVFNSISQILFQMINKETAVIHDNIHWLARIFPA